MTQLERELEAWPHGHRLRVKATGEVFVTSPSTRDGYLWSHTYSSFEPVGAILDATKSLFEQAECVQPPTHSVVVDSVQLQLISHQLTKLGEPFGQAMRDMVRVGKRYKIIVVEVPDE